MIQLYSQYRETEEKKSMGFRMTAWDDKLLAFGQMFVAQMMDLSLNIPLEEALDRGWQILSDCFRPEETGFRTELINEYWPKDKDGAADESDATGEDKAEVVQAVEG